MQYAAFYFLSDGSQIQMTYKPSVIFEMHLQKFWEVRSQGLHFNSSYIYNYFHPIVYISST